MAEERNISVAGILQLAGVETVEQLVDSALIGRAIKSPSTEDAGETLVICIANAIDAANMLPGSRPLSIVRTKLEEAMMWAYQATPGPRRCRSWSSLSEQQRDRIRKAASAYAMPGGAEPDEIGSEMFYVVLEAVNDGAAGATKAT